MRRSNSPAYDRRRSPPRRDRRDFPPRRRRSFSRERYEGNRTRRSSPGFKRFRRDEDHHFDRYERGSPHRRSGHDRDRDSHDRYHDRRDGPESYREFIMNLPNDVTPDEAHRRYQNHLVDWYGSVVKSEFEQFKDEEWMKTKHDPRTILKIIEKHKTHAQIAAKEFAEAMKPGGELDVESESFDQGVLKTTETDTNKEEEDPKAKSFVAPHVCWSKDRIESDLNLSTELVQKLDAEKGITENPILATVPDKKPEVKPEGNGETCDGKEVDEQMLKDSDEANVKRLDLVLTYLWRVHMIDYYSGHELNDKEYENAKCRMLRPPRDHETDEQTDKRMLDELKVRVDNFWSERIKKGDPLQQKTQTGKVEKAIEEFVESQVIEVDSKKWGNKLSNKMFVGKEFVIKHIRLKHSAVVDAEREKILDEIYFDNFRKEKEEQERKMSEERERALRFGPQAMEGSYNGAYPDGFGHGAPGVMAGQGMMGPPIVPAPMMGAAMGQMLMPAPGAGPMGPFVLQPVPTGGGMAPMDMGPMGGAGRGRGMEAPAALPVGRVGSGQNWSGQREYYDLDAPQNNRAVLDYGDL